MYDDDPNVTFGDSESLFNHLSPHLWMLMSEKEHGPVDCEDTDALHALRKGGDLRNSSSPVAFQENKGNS